MNTLIKETSLKNILKIAIPIALQQLLISSLHLVDTAFIVQLGDISTAAVGTAGRVFFLFHVLIFGSCSGMMVLSSQFWGVGDKKTIHQAFGLGMFSALGLGFIMCCLAFFFPRAMINIFTDNEMIISEGAKYIKIASLMFIPMAIANAHGYLLRATEHVIMPLIISFIGVGINTALNYILIFGKLGSPALGIEGAAIATVISSTFQCILFIVLCRMQKNICAVSFRDIMPKTKEFVKKYFSVAMPVFINELIWCTGVNVYVMALARQEVSNYTAYTIFTPFEQIFFTLFIGLGSACSVLLGKIVGRNELKKAYNFAKHFAIYTFLIAILTGGLIFIFAPSLIGLMQVDSLATQAMAIKIMRIFACVLPIFICTYICIVGIFRSAGSTKIGMILDGATVWFVGIPMVWLAAFVFHWDFEYIYLMTFIEHVIKTIICIFIFRKRNWLKPLTGKTIE